MCLVQPCVGTSDPTVQLTYCCITTLGNKDESLFQYIGLVPNNGSTGKLDHKSALTKEGAIFSKVAWWATFFKSGDACLVQNVVINVAPRGLELKCFSTPLHVTTWCVLALYFLLDFMQVQYQY
jgi:hypothetical protein